MIRVLHIGLSQQFGGIESFLLNLSKAMNHGRFQFDYLAYGPKAPREDEFTAFGGIVHHLENRRNPISYARDLCLLMENGYDIVHIHKNSAADIVPFLCARRVPALKVVAHAHSTGSGVGSFASTLNAAGRNIVLASSDARLACSVVAGEWLYGDESKIDAVIPNGIDIATYTFEPRVREHVRAKLEIGDDIVVGCVGRFRREKNQAFLVGVLKELLSRGVSTRMLFLGDGTELESVKSRFIDAGIADRVVFLGNVREVSAYMQAMDALAMPSLFEGFPLVALEGQAAGLPVLLSDRITSEACVTNLALKLPIGNGNEAIWADAIANAVSNASRLHSDTSNLALFDSRVTAERVSEVYSSVAR